MAAQILLVLVLAGAIVLLLIGLRAVKRARAVGEIGTFDSRPALTGSEQVMFWRLLEAFPLPHTVVLSQVSFNALLRAKGVASRESFAQKTADFVLVDKAFRVRAVIALDEDRLVTSDEQHDAMLKKAGYRVLRYRRVPESSRLRNDIPVS